MSAEPNPYEVWATTPGGWDAFTDELGDESCPRCHQVNWGQTPAGLLECASCGYVDQAAGQ